MHSSLTRYFKRTDLVLLTLVVLAVVIPSVGLMSHYVLSGDGARDLYDLYVSYQQHILPLVGPSASVGQFHVGPLFYYLLLPPLIVSGFNPFMPVVEAVIINALVVLMGYKLMKDFATKRAAVLFGILAVASPYLIHLARGSWNPNPQPLAVLVLLYAVMKLIECPDWRYMLVLGLALGSGIQLHYTFLSNGITCVVLLALFRPRIFLDWRLYVIAGAGFALVLLPFGIGQLQHNLVDVRGLWHYLRSSSVKVTDIINPTLLGQHIMTPVWSFFAPFKGWVMGWVEAAMWLGVVAAVGATAWSKGPSRRIARVALAFYGMSAVQAHVKDLSLPYYHLFYSIIVLVMIALALDYLMGKRIWIGVGAAVLLLAWELVTLGTVYRVDRTAAAVSRTADRLYADAVAHPVPGGNATKVYLESSISSWDAYEYRFFLARKGLPTGFGFTGDAEYLIIESRSPKQGRIIPGYTQVAVMPTADASQLVKSIGIYRRSSAAH